VRCLGYIPLDPPLLRGTFSAPRAFVRKTLETIIVHATNHDSSTKSSYCYLSKHNDEHLCAGNANNHQFFQHLARDFARESTLRIPQSVGCAGSMRSAPRLRHPDAPHRSPLEKGDQGGCNSVPHNDFSRLPPGLLSMPACAPWAGFDILYAHAPKTVRHLG